MAYCFESKQPKAIPVGRGDQTFTLRHKRLTGYEKIAVHEAITAGLVAVSRGVADAAGLGLSSVTEILWSKVIAWDGVLDSSGVALPLKTQTDNGELISNLNAVMGSLPIEEIVRAVILQLAINGIRLPTEVQELFAGAVGDSGFAKSMAKEVEDFLFKPGGTDESSSTNSASGEPATPS